MSSVNYLNTVFNIKLIHDGEEISEDYLLHAPIIGYSSTVIDQMDAQTLEFIKRHGFTTSKDEVRSSSSYFSVTNPNYTSVEYYALHTKIAATHLFMDDIFDLTTELFNPKNIEMVQQIIRLLGKYFRCDAVPIAENIRETCPKFVNVCQMYFELGENLKATKKDLSWVYQGFDIMVGGHITQVLPPPKSAEEYLERKIYNFGMIFYFDLICLLTGESLSDDVRNSGWFKEFQVVCSALSVLAVDPISCNYDTSNDIANDNYSAVLIKQGFSVKEAIRKTIIRYNQFYFKSLTLISQMDKMNISEDDRKYLRVYLTAIRSVFEWASNFSMYNPKQIFEYCEVQDTNRAASCVAEALSAIPSI